MIKTVKEYYELLGRLRTANFNQKLSIHLQSKLEAFEEVEDLINTKSQQCDRCYDTSGFYLGTSCPKCNRPFRSVKTVNK